MLVLYERKQLWRPSAYQHELKVQHIFESAQKHIFYVPGYYGNEIDGVAMPKTKGKKGGGDGDEEETELIQNSSEEEMDDDGDLNSVATTPPMKPVITDRSEQIKKSSSQSDNNCSSERYSLTCPIKKRKKLKPKPFLLL